ncbi:MAG: hypothetical protein WC996_06670 [Peptostreptococcales bacterium]
MAKYKILNVTYKLNKRDVNYNKTLSFEVTEGFKINKVKIEPNQLIYLDINKLPLSLQKYRMEGLITILQINDLDYKRELKEFNKKKLVVDNKDDKTSKKTKEIDKKTTSKQNKINSIKKDVKDDVEKID